MFRRDRDPKRQRIIAYDNNADDGISCLTNPATLEKEKEKEKEKTASLRYNYSSGSENSDDNDDDDESVESVYLDDDYAIFLESFDLSKHVLCNLLNAHDEDADCKIFDVENSCINTEEAEKVLHTLKKMLHWIEMGETRFMDDFYNHDGLNVLTTFMAGVTQSGDSSCVEAIVEFIEVSTQIITQHCEFLLNLLNDGNFNERVTILYKSGYIDALLAVNGLYDVHKNIDVVAGIWDALQAIVSLQTQARKSDSRESDETSAHVEGKRSVFDAGVTFFFMNDAEDCAKVPCVHLTVLNTLCYIVDEGYNAAGLDDAIPNILSLLFKEGEENLTWNYWVDENLIQSIIHFVTSCSSNNMLDNKTDYEALLPFLVKAWKEYPDSIYFISDRKGVYDFIDTACYHLPNKIIIEESGVLELLVEVLSSSKKCRHDDEKKMVRALLQKIVS